MSWQVGLLVLRVYLYGVNPNSVGFCFKVVEKVSKGFSMVKSRLLVLLSLGEH